MKSKPLKATALLLAATLAVPGLVFASELPVLRGVGGDFRMNSTLGHEASLSEFSDKLVLLTFGYTNCPDVCPVTLGFLNKVMAELGAQAGRTQVLFVSLDPEYDTPEKLKNYLAFFNRDFIGLMARREVLDDVARKYNIRYGKLSSLQVSTRFRKLKIPNQAQQAQPEEADTSSLYYHSTVIYLIDSQGRVRSSFDTTTAVTRVVDGVRALLGE